MKTLSTLLIVSASSLLWGQAPVQVCIGDDTTACNGQAVEINHCQSASSSTGLVLNNSLQVNLGDDSFSGAIPLGFNFSFYGQTYSQVLIGSNGILSFDLSKANGICQWALAGVTLPNTSLTSAKNTAMLCYQDLNPSNPNSGPIRYQTVGQAPNRKFVVLYDGVTMFACTNSCAYISIILSEGTNQIEVHIGSKGSCPTWNNDLAIQGTQDNLGLMAHIPLGRNNAQWTAQQDGMRWTPLTSSNTSAYTVQPIPYLNVFTPSNNLVWKSTTGQSYPYNGGLLNVTLLPPGTSGYYLEGTSCGVSTGVVSDTTYITRTNFQVSASANDALCGSNNGTVIAQANSGYAPYTYSWSGQSSQSNVLMNVSPGTYTATITDATGCVASASATVGTAPAVVSIAKQDITCFGENNGSALATIVPAGNNVTYLWDDPQAQSTSQIGGLAPGTYTCTVQSDNGCSGQATVSITEPASINPQVQNIIDVDCHGKNNGAAEVSVSGGQAPLSYTWSGSNQTGAQANNLFAGNQHVTVTDANGCEEDVTFQLSEPDALSFAHVSPDTSVCKEDEIILSVSPQGGSSNYAVEWSLNGQIIHVGNTMPISNHGSSSVYEIELREACGSAPANEQIVVKTHTPIEINFASIQSNYCAPATIALENISSPLADVATTFVELGKQSFELNGDQELHAFIENHGWVSMEVMTRSVHGCVYQASLNNVVEVLKAPEARFIFPNNPVKTANTLARVMNYSKDAADYEWFAPDASPNYSTELTPSFSFPNEEGSYPVDLIVWAENGCSDTAYGDFLVNDGLLVWAPTAFTPDGNNINATWKLVVDGVVPGTFHVEIFDRWGSKVFETANPDEGWDGTDHGRPLPSGSYTWNARMEGIHQSGSINQQGNIMLLK